MVTKGDADAPSPMAASTAAAAEPTDVADGSDDARRTEAGLDEVAPLDASEPINAASVAEFGTTTSPSPLAARDESIATCGDDVRPDPDDSLSDDDAAKYVDEDKDVCPQVRASVADSATRGITSVSTASSFILLRRRR